MSQYKIIIRNSPGWRNHKAATLGVSVLSPNWQEEKFASILAFATTNFEIIRIDVTDALYRHHFMAEGASPEEALAQANVLGALWLAQHQDIINTSSIKPQVIRWGEWHTHPDYDVTLADIQHAYALNAVLHEAVHNDIMEFYRRKQRDPSQMEYEHSKNYLLEEIAVACLQGRELPSTKIYPGDELLCMNVVRHNLVPEAPKGLEYEQFAKVKFKIRHRKFASAVNDQPLHMNVKKST